MITSYNLFITEAKNLNLDLYSPEELAKMICKEEGSPKKIKELIDQGADLNFTTFEGWSIAHYLTIKDAGNQITAIAQSGANLDLKTKKTSSTPLHLAAEHEFSNAARALIKGGASLDVQNVYRNTPLHLAVDKRCLKITEMLIKAGANLDLQDLHGQTALHLAIQKDFHIITEMLIKAGANLVLEDSFGRTPTDLALEFGFTQIAQLLLDAGAQY